MKSDIGECVSVLYYKLWGKTLVGTKLHSRKWWENRLATFVNSPTVTINPEENTRGGMYDKDGNEIPPPIRFEDEMGLDESLSEHWLEFLQTLMRRP